MSIYLVIASILFVIGLLTCLVRKNVILILLGIELMLNACNLFFVTFSKINGDIFGQTFSLYVIVVAAAEIVAGLVVVLKLYKKTGEINIDLLSDMKE
jgi:NADH-quinone oxidoreductase subunit K